MECKDYNECITCIYFDDCGYKPINYNFKYTLLWCSIFGLAFLYALGYVGSEFIKLIF